MGSCRRKPSSNGLVRTEGQVLRMHDQLDLTKRACFHLCILIKMDGRKLLPLDYVTIFGIFRLVHCQVTQCYIGVLDAYANPNTLTMFDMSEVMTYKLIDCDKAHYPKEIIQVNERRYEFGLGIQMDRLMGGSVQRSPMMEASRKTASQREKRLAGMCTSWKTATFRAAMVRFVSVMTETVATLIPG